MTNIINVSLVFVLFGIICAMLIPLFQKLSLRLRGERFEFFIGKRHIRSNRDWWDFLFSALVGALSFILAGLIVSVLIETGFLSRG